MAVTAFEVWDNWYCVCRCVWGGGGGGIALHMFVLAICIIIAALTSYRSATTTVCCGHGIRRRVCVCVDYEVDDSPQSTVYIPLAPDVLAFVFV